MIPAFTQTGVSEAEIVQNTDRIRITFDGGSEIETSELFLQNDSTTVSSEDGTFLQLRSEYRAAISATYVSRSQHMILFTLELIDGSTHQVEWPLTAFLDYICEPSTSIQRAKQ
jgi:hypothetical protein